MLVDTGLPQTVCAPQTIHNVGSPSARGAFSFPSTHTPSPGFSPGLVWSRSRPSSKFRGRKPGLCLPLDFCPNFSVFSFFLGGGTPPREIYSVLHSQARNFGRGAFVASEGGKGGRLVFILFSEVGVVEVLSNGRTAEPRKPGRRHREPRPHKSGTRARALLDQRHRHSPSASDEALCIL